MSTDVYFATLVDCAPDALVVFDEQGVIRNVNKRTAQLFGYAQDELRNASLSQLVPLGLPQPTDAGTPHTLMAEARHKAGHTLPVEVAIARIDTPTDALFSAAFRCRSVTTPAKAEFLSSMSHELRSPLNVIIGFAKLMYRGRVGTVSEPQREYLGDILDSAEHLLQLIDDLVDLSKLDAGRMDFHPEPVNLELLLHEVQESLESVTLATHTALDMRVASECVEIESDPEKLRQLLRNTLAHALQRTAQGGSVQLQVQQDGANQLRFEIRAGQQPNAGATRHQPDGGLSLALAQRLVEQQGGRTGVSHELDQGSTYYVVLPRKLMMTLSPGLGVT